MARASKTLELTFRKLIPGDQPLFEAHLLGLNELSRRSRFGMAATDTFLTQYAERCMSLNATIHGAFAGEMLVGVSELRPIAYLPTGDAEIAFSVSEEWRNVGIGTALFGRVIRSARNRGYTRLYMTCISRNAPMQALARKFAAEIIVDFDETIGMVEAHRPTIISILMEAFDDASNFAMLAFAASRFQKPLARRRARR